MALLIAGAGSSWKKVDTAVTGGVSAGYEKAAPQDRRPSLAWEKPVPKQAQNQLTYKPIPNVDANKGIVFGGVISSIDTPKDNKWGVLSPLDAATTLPFGGIIQPIDNVWRDHYYGALPEKDKAYADLYRSVFRFSEGAAKKPYQLYIPSFSVEYNRQYAKVSFDFSDPLPVERKVLPYSIDCRSKAPWEPTIKVDTYISRRYGHSRHRAIIAGPYRTVFLVPPPDPVDPDPEPTDPPVIEKAYHIMNIVNLVSLPDLTPIAFSQATLSRDIDSYAWTLSASLMNQASVDLISPRGGAIKEVRLTINGDVWEFFVSKISETERFANKTWAVLAYSKSKLLSSPYSVQKTHTETSSSTAAQLATNELFGTGFTLNWSAVDWSIPANVFSYSGQAPIASVLSLTNAIGAVIAPHPANNELTVKPRFTHSAWDWDAATEDRTIPRALFSEMSEEYQPQIKYNAVYVAGQEYGALAKVQQLGTAGDSLLPDIVDNLLTDAIANTERGRIELSKSGHKEVFSGRIFYDPSEGFVDIGELVKIVASDGTSWKGVATANSISISKMGAVVYQNLRILRHYE